MSKNTLTRGLSYGTLTFGLISLLTVVSSILTARLYGIHVVGEFALVMAPATAVAVLSTVREQPALVRRLAGIAPRDPLVTGLFGAVFAFSVALTIAAAALAAIATWFLFHGPIDHPNLFPAALVGLIGYVLISNTAWNFDFLFTAFMASGPLFRVRLSQAVLFPAFVAGLRFVRVDVWSLVAAYYASWGIATVYRLWAVRAVLSYRLTAAARRQGREELPGILKFGLRITPGFLAIGASNQAGTWILGASASVSSVGAFNRASTVTGRLGELNFRITEMLFPALVTRRDEGDTIGFDRAVVDTLRYSLVGLLAFAAVLGGASTGILRLFGAGFQMAATALPMLALVPAAMAATAVLAHTMFAFNRTNATTALAGLRLLITAGGGVVLTGAYGLNGMAAASALGAIAQLVAQASLTLRQLSTPVRRLWPLRQALGIVAAYASGFAAAKVVDQAIPGPGGLLAALAVGAVAYAIGFLVVGGLLDRDRHRMMMVRGRLATEFALPLMGPERRRYVLLRNVGSSFAGALSIGSLAALLTALLLPAREAEHYGVLALTIGVGAIALAVSNSVAARIMRLPRDEHREALEGALRRIIGFQCVIVAPAAVCATPIAHALLGSGYSRADVLTVMLPYIFCCGIAPPLIHAINNAGQAKRQIPISLVALALTSTISLLLIPRHGVLGAALAINIGFGMYTIAHVSLCRRVLGLRIRMLVWSLACGLTAAAAMALVLASVATKTATTSDWLKAGIGGLAVYVAMLIFTREMTVADICRATATLGSRLGRLHLVPRRSRPASPATQPPRPLPLIARDCSAAKRASLSLEHNSPAARPPAWVMASPHDPAEVVQASAVGRSRSETQIHSAFGRHRPPPVVAPQRDDGAPSAGMDDGVYQIAWRGRQDSGVFELRPVEPRLASSARAIEVSSPVSWGWRIEPAPVPEAQQAHGAFIHRLVAAGWRGAGSGDAWFAHRFRPPDRVAAEGPRQ